MGAHLRKNRPEITFKASLGDTKSYVWSHIEECAGELSNWPALNVCSHRLRYKTSGPGSEIWLHGRENLKEILQLKPTDVIIIVNVPGNRENPKLRLSLQSGSAPELHRQAHQNAYLGDAAMRMSFLKTDGLSIEAMHPIMPDIECPTYVQLWMSISSRIASKSSA